MSQPQGTEFGKDVIDCLYCDLNYYDISALVQHMRIQHLDEVPVEYKISKYKTWKWFLNQIVENKKLNDK